MTPRNGTLPRVPCTSHLAAGLRARLQELVNTLDINQDGKLSLAELGAQPNVLRGWAALALHVLPPAHV